MPDERATPTNPARPGSPPPSAVPATPERLRRRTVPAVRAVKRRDGAPPLVMLTAYDTPSARIADAAGVDIVLVGDSVANNVLGFPDTLHVDVDVLVHHVAAVARAQTEALVVADLPWLSYHLDPATTIRNGAALVRAGAGAVKLEGGRARVPMVEALVGAEIPVMGHLGLTPQSVHTMGGYRVQGRSDEAAEALLADATALVDAGCFAVVLEGVPASLGTAVTAALDVPTIGIGAGPDCDGQVLVFHDVLGFNARVPRFVRTYANLAADATAALEAFVADVRAGTFPSEAESYR